MGNAINNGGDNAFILNKLRPLRERVISGIESAGGFITGTYYLEQKTGRGRAIG
jgi:hypothetical protein